MIFSSVRVEDVNNNVMMLTLPNHFNKDAPHKVMIDFQFPFFCKPSTYQPDPSKGIALENLLLTSNCEVTAETLWIPLLEKAIVK